MAKSSTSRAADVVADATENTVEELRSLLTEAEQALASGGDSTSPEVSALRERVRNVLAETRNAARQAADFTREQARRADELVHSHPYAAIGIAAGIGLVAGLLLNRCSNSR